MPTNVDKEKIEIVKGSAVNLLGGNAAQVLSLMAVMMATHMVGIENFGLYTLGAAIVFFVRPLGHMGMERGVLKFVAEYSSTENDTQVYRTIASALRIGIPINIAFSLALLALAPVIASGIFGKADLGSIICIVSFTLPLVFITDICLFSLRALRIMSAYYYCQIIRQTFYIGLLFLLYRYGMDKSKLLAWAYLGSTIVAGFVAFWFFARRFSTAKTIKSIFTQPLDDKLLRFSLCQTFSSVLGVMLRETDILLLGIFWPTGGVGVYRIASRIAEIILIFLRSIRGIFAPIIASLWAQGKTQELRQLFAVTTRWICTFSLPLFLLIVLFPDTILGVFGSDYQEGTAVLIILSVGQIINAMAGVVGFMLIMSGFAGLHLLSDSIVLIVNLILNLLLIPRYGIIGAAIGTASSIALGNLIRLYFVHVKIRMQPYSKAFTKPLLAGAVATAITVLAYHIFNYDVEYALRLAITATVFTGVYLISLLLLKLESDDKQLLKSVFASRMAIRSD